jgi:hypothetical protein
VRRERRKEMKKQLRDDKNILYKKQRLLDSDDDDLKVYNNDVDMWNKTRKDVLKLVMDSVQTSGYFMGFGVPLRTPSYILGYQPHSETEIKKKKPYRRRNSSRTPERDNN